MNVFLNASNLSPAMDRIVKQLIRYAPDNITVVNKQEDADLVVLHTIGYPETESAAVRLLALGKKYAIIQYCLRTTQKPHCQDWLAVWAGAEFVWSYYDLQALCEEDGVRFPTNTLFYLSPLGVDSLLFHAGFALSPYPYKILTTGTLAPFETVDLVNKACQTIGATQGHLGELKMKPDWFDDGITRYHSDVSDKVLAALYRQTEYVSGLRRIEGFELPAAEGLCSGAVPILFDKPHYRQWYGDLGAVFIKEGTDEEIYKQLVDVLSKPADRNLLQIEEAKTRFDWRVICRGFWACVGEQTPEVVRPVVQFTSPKRRLAWVGDAVAATGFAKGTHKIMETLQKDWDIHILGLNYYGDPHPYPYKIYPSKNGGDFFGVGRLPWLIENVRPELIVIQNDPWNFPQYMKSVGNVPVVGIAAVDGLNCRGTDLNGLTHTIFWTEFGANEAARGGYRGSSSVIPLGVDLEIYKPISKETARKAMGIHEYVGDSFVVGNINRNQPRKRLDLTIQYFCEWIHRFKINDAYLYLHIAPTADQGYDAKQLMKYYGVSGRLILAIPEMLYGVKESMMPYTYNCFDIQMTTTQGEGFGLTTLEGMACGIPQIVPDWSALGELFAGSAELIPCSTTAATPNNINVIGGVPDKEVFIHNLNRMYKDHLYRLRKSEICLDRSRDEMFQWGRIGQQYADVLNNLFVQGVGQIA